jgi:hypothetical protein
VGVGKFEFSIEAIIVFVKSIKKTSSGMFTLLVSQQYELLKKLPFVLFFFVCVFDNSSTGSSLMI